MQNVNELNAKIKDLEKDLAESEEYARRLEQSSKSRLQNVRSAIALKHNASLGTVTEEGTVYSGTTPTCA